jgi:hypothetical protein
MAVGGVGVHWGHVAENEVGLRAILSQTLSSYVEVDGVALA